MPEKPNFTALNRYHDKSPGGGISKAGIALAKKFVAGNAKREELPSWAKRFADYLEVKGDKLILDGKEIIAKENRETVMRDLVYTKDSDVGLARDAGYYQIKKRYWNIQRRKWQEFLKAQESIRKTDNLPPRQKSGGRKLKRKGELEADLFVISKKDLPAKLQKSLDPNPKSLKGAKAGNYQCLNVVDRLTSYCKVFYVRNATAATVRNGLEKALKAFEELLDMKRSEFIVLHDDGGEFRNEDSWKMLKVKHAVVNVGNKVEQKNSHVQRIFHRLKNSNRMTSVSDGLLQAEKIANESYNRVLKMSPSEAVTKYNGPAGDKLMQRYNAARAKGSEDMRGPLKVGNKVRKVLRPTKKATDYTFVKAYHGKTFTDELYTVTKVKRKGDMTLYQLNNKDEWFRRDRLSENTPHTDLESRKLTKKTKVSVAKEEEEKKEEESPPKSESKKASKGSADSKQPPAKKKSAAKQSAAATPSNVIESHEVQTFKDAPHFKSKQRAEQVLKWVKYQFPVKKTDTYWISKSDLDYVYRYLVQVNDYYEHLEKHLGKDKKYKKYIHQRQLEIGSYDSYLGDLNVATKKNKRKPTWKVARNFGYRGQPIKPDMKPKKYSESL